MEDLGRVQTVYHVAGDGAIDDDEVGDSGRESVLVHSAVEVQANAGLSGDIVDGWRRA